VPPNLSWGYSRPYAVLQRTLDEDCRQAEEPKQLVDEASWFYLRRQRQHSVVICSGTLLFSSRVLRLSLVTLCSHKSGQCAVDASHLWYPPFYTSPMASSALQHWTINSHLVCDPAIRQPGFNFPRQQWSLLNRFRMEQDTAVPAEGNGDLQTTICVIVARPRRCLTLSNPVP